MPNPMTHRPLYQDVNAPNNTGHEPCLSYRPYVTLKGGQVVYVLNVPELKRTAGNEWGRIKEKLDSGEIPRAKLATAMELQTLEGVNIPTLPDELTEIVRSALAPKA